MVVLAAYACFALRIAIPAGFMPAPLAQGGPVIVCDGGFDGALLARAAASHSHHHDHMAMAHDHGSMPMAADHTMPMHGDGADHEGVHAAWKHCPVGAVFGIAALATVVVPPIALDLAFDAPPPPQGAASSTERRAYYRSRAPPVALS